MKGLFFPVILSPSAVVLSAAKDLWSSLRADSAKNLRSFSLSANFAKHPRVSLKINTEVLRFAQDDRRGDPFAATWQGNI